MKKMVEEHSKKDYEKAIDRGMENLKEAKKNGHGAIVAITTDDGHKTGVTVSIARVGLHEIDGVISTLIESRTEKLKEISERGGLGFKIPESIANRFIDNKPENEKRKDLSEEKPDDTKFSLSRMIDRIKAKKKRD